MFYHPTWEDVIASLHPRELAELGAILLDAEKAREESAPESSGPGS